MVLPEICRTWLLQRNRCLVYCVVEVHIISMLLVLVHSICLLEVCPFYTNCTECFFDHTLICLISVLQHHRTVFLFIANTRRGKLSISLQSSSTDLKTLIYEVVLDCFTINIAGPLPPLINESGSIECLILHIHQYLNNLESIIQHNNIICDAQHFCDALY